mmetsp:Transcript_25181/g.40415  ORF Transcript_25181/g.40415 Transcript_25181/m.40415 type:complete len:94 (-) Transcript_25181:638-919(-)
MHTSSSPRRVDLKVESPSSAAAPTTQRPAITTDFITITTTTTTTTITFTIVMGKLGLAWTMRTSVCQNIIREIAPFRDRHLWRGVVKAEMVQV